MSSYVTPKKNTAFKCYIGLVDQSNTKLLKANPTIAAGDFKVSIDGGAFANLTTLPSANPASGRAVMIDLSAAEMNGDNIQVQCVDASGAEWCDQFLNIQTSSRQVDDLAYPATSGRSMVVDASGLVDSNVVKLGPTGSGTAQTAGDVGGVSAAIKAKTDNLPSSPAAVGSAMTLESGERDSVAAALLDLTSGIETGLTFRQGLRLIAAAIAGKVSGAAGTTITIRNAVADSKDRIVATVDSDGNRSSLTLDLS